MVNVALIGYGYWGPNLARSLHALEESTLAICCDQDSSRLAHARELYPYVRTTTDVTGIWNDDSIGAVVIATPARTHFTLAQAALAAGKHVLVEKPLTLDSREAQRLIELAQERGLVLMTGHTFEYNPAVLKIKELMDQGQLGSLYYAYSTRVNLGRVQQDLNALWSIAPHDISILLLLFGRMPCEVAARGACYLTKDIEDVVFVDLVFPDGATAHVHASWLDPSKVRRMTIVGSEKMVVYDDVETEAKVKVYDKGVLKVGNDQVFGEFHHRLHSGDIHIPQIEMSEPLRNECKHFLDCISRPDGPLEQGENGLRVVKVLEAAQRSLLNHGTPVKIT